jgi:hypothetical protein
MIHTAPLCTPHRMVVLHMLRHTAVAHRTAVAGEKEDKVSASHKF